MPRTAREFGRFSSYDAGAAQRRCCATAQTIFTAEKIYTHLTIPEQPPATAERPSSVLLRDRALSLYTDDINRGCADRRAYKGIYSNRMNRLLSNLKIGEWLQL